MASIVNRHSPGQADEIADALHLAGEPSQREPLAFRDGSTVVFHDQSHPAAVHKPQTVEVEDERRRVAGPGFLEVLREGGRRGEVKLPIQLEDETLARFVVDDHEIAVHGHPAAGHAAQRTRN